MVKKNFFEYDGKTKVRILPTKNPGVYHQGVYWVINTKNKPKNDIRKDKINNILNETINL